MVLLVSWFPGPVSWGCASSSPRTSGTVSPSGYPSFSRAWRQEPCGYCQLVAHHFPSNFPRADDLLPLTRGGLQLVCWSLCSSVVSLSYLSCQVFFSCLSWRIFGLIPCHPTSLPLWWGFPGALPCPRCCGHHGTLLLEYCWCVWARFAGRDFLFFQVCSLGVTRGQSEGSQHLLGLAHGNAGRFSSLELVAMQSFCWRFDVVVGGSVDCDVVFLPPMVLSVFFRIRHDTMPPCFLHVLCISGIKRC